MVRRALGALLVLGASAAPAAAQPFGGLNVDSVCSDWQRASPSDRHTFIDDLLSGYSMNARRTLTGVQRVEAQRCVGAFYAAPCVTGAMTARQSLAMCLTTLGIGR